MRKSTFKKALSILIMSTMLLGLLSGCGGQSTEEKLRNTTDETLKALQKFDLDTVSKMIQDTESESDSEDKASEATTEAADDEMMKLLTDYLTESASKMTYEIKSVDEEKLTVDVTCTYVDSGDLVTNIYSNLITVAFAHLDGSEITDEETNKIIESAISSVKEEKTATKDFKLVYEEKDGKYQLKETPDELLDVATAGIYGYFKSISDATEADEKEAKEYEDASEQISYEYEKCKNGAFLTVTNNSDKLVDITVQVLFNDKDGNMVGENEQSIYCVASKQSKSIGINAYNADYETVDYDSINVQFKTSKTYYKDASEALQVETNNGEDGLIAKITNNNDFDVDDVTANVIYYKDGKAIFFECGSEYDLKAGKYAAISISSPYDPFTFDSLEYDDYKAYVYGTSYEQ